MTARSGLSRQATPELSLTGIDVNTVGTWQQTPPRGIMTQGKVRKAYSHHMFFILYFADILLFIVPIYFLNYVIIRYICCVHQPGYSMTLLRMNSNTKTDFIYECIDSINWKKKYWRIMQFNLTGNIRGLHQFRPVSSPCQIRLPSFWHGLDISQGTDVVFNHWRSV